MSDAEAKTETRSIAFVDAGGGAPASALLADVAEATPVYAALSGTKSPELVRPRCGRELAGCDTVLLALTMGAADVDDLPVGHASAGTHVYALICTDGDPTVAAHALAALEERCEERGLAWMGGLAVGDAGLLPNMARRARMGWARRRVSEMVDQLIIALLARQPFGEKYVRPSRYARITCRPR